MNRRNLLKVLPGLLTLPLIASGIEPKEWNPTEEEIKHIFQSVGFHISPYNMGGPVALLNLDTKSCYSREEMNTWHNESHDWRNRRHRAIEAAAIFVTDREHLVSIANNFRSLYDHNLFAFYMVKRVSDIKVSEMVISEKYHNKLIKNDMRIMVRGAWLKL